MFDYVSFKRSGYYGFSACLFVACALFVTHRGYKCLKKYAEEPESAEVSYKFTGDVTFPVITLCTSSFLESVKYVLTEPRRALQPDWTFCGPDHQFRFL